MPNGNDQLPQGFLDQIDNINPDKIVEIATGLRSPADIDTPEDEQARIDEMISTIPDDELIPLRAKLSPLAGKAAGFPVEPEEALGFGEIVKQAKGTSRTAGRVLKELATSPELIVPTVLGVAGTIAGGPAVGAGAAGVGGGMVKAIRLDEEKQKKEPLSPVRAMARRSFPSFAMIDTLVNASQTPEDIIDIAGATALDAALEASGFFISKIAARTGKLKLLKNSVDPTVKALEAEFTRLGGTFSLAQLTNNSIVDLLEGMGRAGFLSKEIFTNLDEVQKAALAVNRKEIADTFARGVKELGDEEIGTLFRNADNLGQSAHKAISDNLYDKIDDLAGGTVTTETVIDQVPSGRNIATGLSEFKEVSREARVIKGGVQVPQDEIKQFAARVVADEKEIAKIGTNSTMSRMLRRISNLDDQLTFKSTSRVRSSLLKINRLAKAQGDSATEGLSRAAAAIVDGSMEKSSKRLLPEANKAWREANAFFKQGKEIFEDGVVANLVASNKKYASEIGKAISTFNKPEQVRDLKRIAKKAAELTKTGEFGRAVDAEELIDAARFGHFETMVTKASKPSADEVVDTTFLKLSGLWDRARPVTKELYTPDQIARIDKFIKLGVKVQKKQAKGAIFGLAQSGAIFSGMGLSFFRSPIAGAITIGTTLAAPVFISKAIQNPRAIKFLTEGIEIIGKRGEAGIQAAFDLVSRATKEIMTADLKQKEAERRFGASFDPAKREKFLQEKKDSGKRVQSITPTQVLPGIPGGQLPLLGE